MFNSEQEMSIQFEKFLKTNFGNTFLKEQTGLFGVPDFVFYSKYEEDYAFISFELKLKNWKRAAKQAFRYKSFSNATYVVIDSNYEKAALKNIDFFKQYNIGLASFINENFFKIYFKPTFNEPFSKNLKLKLVDSISHVGKTKNNIDSFWS